MTDTPFLVHVIPALDPADIKVQASGSAVEFATPADLTPWNLDQAYWLKQRIFNFLNEHGYHAPSEPLLASCFHGDSFDRKTMVIADPDRDGRGFGHYAYPADARVKLTALDAEIVSLTRQPTIIDSAIWDNRNEENPHDFSATVETEVQDTVESHWDVSHGLTESIDVKVGVGPVDTEGSVSYETTWGEGGSHSTTKSVSTSDTISGSVEPGAMQLAALVCQRGVLTVKVRYRFELLDGNIRAWWYGKRGKGGLHVGQPVTGAAGSGIDASNLAAPIVPVVEFAFGEGATVRESTQILTCDFFADADLSAHPLKDKSPEAISEAIGGTDLVQVYP